MVSIHAPAWGATMVQRYTLYIRYVSIHAPAWGATEVQYWPYLDFMFQSTHPRGVRLFTSGSITGHLCFNPRTRVGCDRQRMDAVADYERFNPRTRVGCDCYPGSLSMYIFDVSIHAPAWGATGIDMFGQLVHQVSIHAPAWGAT